MTEKVAAKKYEVYYNEQLIFNNLIMTEIPYIIVKNYMDKKSNYINFEKFKNEFDCIKKIISSRGPTQFILEKEEIGDKDSTKSIRASNYYNQRRPLLKYNHNSVITEFGVWTQWKANSEDSNFNRFIKEIKKLNYRIIEKDIDQIIKRGKIMSSITYSELKKIVDKILKEQNIGVKDLGVDEGDYRDENIKCFDMALIKKITGSNSAVKGDVKSKQSAILLTGEQASIFPCVRAAEFNGAQVGKSIIFKIDVRLMANNMSYINGNLSENSENEVIESYLTTNETKDRTRVELGCKTLDGNKYVEFYNSIPVNGRLVILKLKYKLEYVFMIIREEDEEEYIGTDELEDITTFFESRKLTVNNKDDRTYLTQNDLKLNYIGKNKIYYGAPGTGKSNHVNVNYYDKYAKRVTFHPEYTYNDFIGYIRPKLDNGELKYSFTPGPFTEILGEALKNKYNIYTLIIEEINRANTAAVFGDLFQLLDRDENGNSEYKVNNVEIYNHIIKNIGSKYDLGNGNIFIPFNLNIVATMNTADQNVFVMDTAFKRRWEFEYIKVAFEESHKFKNNKIQNLNITWEKFVTKVNDFIMSKEQEDLMIAEDKQIGPYFIKEKELTDSYKFAYKVLLYLWDDVLKMDRYRLFNNDIRTFSNLVEKFTGTNPLNIFNDNFRRILTVDEDKLDGGDDV